MLPALFRYIGYIFPATGCFDLMTGATPSLSNLLPLVLVGIIAVAVCTLLLVKAEC